MSSREVKHNLIIQLEHYSLYVRNETHGIQWWDLPGYEASSFWGGGREETKHPLSSLAEEISHFLLNDYYGTGSILAFTVIFLPPIHRKYRGLIPV
jgi:hypothetical protein